MTFYFYDLETTGFNPREARIMQFGGQRTDMDLQPIDEPHNVYIKLTDDIVPDPEAILITGITPQKTIADGVTEPEFLELFYKEISVPDTIFVGFNSVRFDDEFMRFLNYRNFYDAYEWQWQGGRSRWDMLDVVRMTRALRPRGIKWPFDSEGKPSNRLQQLTEINKIYHVGAHDALSDVNATIAVAKLIKQKQPKLFEYLLKMRDKKEVASVVFGGQPFVYTSGKYASEFEKTTVVTTLAEHPKKQGALVFDLRHDPEPFITMSPEQLADAWKWNPDADALRLPVKTLQFNRVPAIAPLGVLDDDSKKRLDVDLDKMLARRKRAERTEFVQNILKAIEILDKKQQAEFFANEQTVDAQLYDGFISSQDKPTMAKVHNAKPETLTDLGDKFKDQRLKNLMPLYKARNFPKSLTSEEREQWEKYRSNYLMSGDMSSRLAKYFARLEEISQRPSLTKEQGYLLEELQLYGQSVVPDY